jgi:hypothetical protein
MDPLHPLAGAPLTSGETQRQIAESKRRQIRQAQAAAKHIAHYADGFEAPVESAEAAAPIHDETPERQPRKQNRRNAGPSDEDDGREHIDLKA